MIQHLKQGRRPTMKLRGVDYGRIFCAVGARGMFGEGYPFHRPWRFVFRVNLDKTTLATKTITMDRVEGNMPLRKDGLTPVEFEPGCIYVDFLSSLMHNAVGLSNFGVPFYLEQNRWQLQPDPFVITFKAISTTKVQRLEETRQFIKLLQRYLPFFRAPVALQFNFGCPNVKHESDDLLQEIGETLQEAAVLGIPLMVNFSVVAPPDLLVDVLTLDDCDALWLANTIEWGYPGIDWEATYRSAKSPTVLRGYTETNGSPCQGGYSGPLALPFAIERVMLVRAAGVDKPIVAGNGIRRPRDVKRLFNVGVDAVAYGSGYVVEPWNSRAVIRTARDVHTWGETRL